MDLLAKMAFAYVNQVLKEKHVNSNHALTNVVLTEYALTVLVNVQPVLKVNNNTLNIRS